MRVLLALSAVLFCGIARADYMCNPGDGCVSQTFVGIVTGGTDSGDGTFDDANLFNIGGGSTLGDTILINVQYDVDAIVNNGSVFNDSYGYGYSFENPATGTDYQISATLLGTGTTFTVTPPGDGQSYFYTEIDGYNDLGYNDYFTSGVDNTLGTELSFAAYSYSDQISPFDPTNINQVLQILDDPTAQIQFTGYTGFGETATDTLFFDPTTLQVSATPEPSTWFSLATGLAGLAFLKFRRKH